jgi:transcriptional regulator with XRE-family HTH domain
MTSQLRQLRQARGLTMQTLADRVGTSKSQIDKLEKGERRLTLEWMQRLAEGLDCVVTDIIGPPTPAPVQSWPDYSGERDLPIRGRRSGGMGGISFAPVKSREYVTRPANLLGIEDAFAVYASDETMEPRFYAGEILFVHPNRPLSRGCFVVLEMTDGQGLVRQFLRQDAETLTLHQFNPDRDIVLRRESVKNIYRIVASTEGA